MSEEQKTEEDSTLMQRSPNECNVVEPPQTIIIRDKNISFRPLVVVEFSSWVQDETIDWFISKIQAPKARERGELLVQNGKNNQTNKRFILVGAVPLRLLTSAENMEIRKEHTDGTLREFTQSQLGNIRGMEDGNELAGKRKHLASQEAESFQLGDIDSFLTMAEQQRIILHELENIRVVSAEQIAGISKEKLIAGESIFRRCIKLGIIAQSYPLHDRDALKKIKHHYGWYDINIRAGKLGITSALSSIREYFGDSIAMYFAFINCYLMFLIPPAISGVLSYFLPWERSEVFTAFALFNVIWSTLFLEFWKRRANEFAYRWGTIGMETFEEPRASYHGPMHTSAITGRVEPHYPKWKRTLKKYLVTYPITAMCLVAAISIMMFYFYVDGSLKAYLESLTEDRLRWYHQLFKYVPSLVYTLVVSSFNAIYRRLADVLTEWENHRLQSTFENHLVVKLLLFDSINCFLSFLYVAFYKQDFELLRRLLFCVLVVQQLCVDQIRDLSMPYFVFKARERLFWKKYSKQYGGPAPKPKSSADPLDVQLQRESCCPKFRGTFDEYLKLFLQFGYVFLFAAFFPLASFCALLNNLVEIRTDAFKICNLFQRPFAQPVASIGVWQTAFELLGIFSVLTNTALVAFSSKWTREVLAPLTETQYVLVFVAFEHIVLGIKIVISYAIPDIPRWIQNNLEKVQYESKQALKRERSEIHMLRSRSYDTLGACLKEQDAL